MQHLHESQGRRTVLGSDWPRWAVFRRRALRAETFILSLETPVYTEFWTLPVAVMYTIYHLS